MIEVSHSCSLEQSCIGTECTEPFLFQMGSAYLALAAIQFNLINIFLNIIATPLCTQCTCYDNIKICMKISHTDFLFGFLNWTVYFENCFSQKLGDILIVKDLCSSLQLRQHTWKWHQLSVWSYKYDHLYWYSFLKNLKSPDFFLSLWSLVSLTNALKTRNNSNELCGREPLTGDYTGYNH